MKLSTPTMLILLSLCIGCTQNKNNPTPSSEDSSGVLMQEDTITSEWAPIEFKKEHYDEWVVVEQAINIQQKGEEIDFSQIDKLVKDYIGAKNINLPNDKCRQIKKISEICESKFDIDGYDDSNMGMHIADGTRRLFGMYVNWLYEQEAQKVLEKTNLVDIKKELELYKNLHDATYSVCDSVAFCMDGSGGWIAGSQLHDLSLSYTKLMYQAIIGASIETGKELDFPFEVFDKECAALIANYEPYSEMYPKDAAPIVNRFKQAYHSWYKYRKSVAAHLSNKKFKKAYNSITYSYTRLYLLHLKNRFSDIGLSDGYACLDEDCSNKELLEFNFEANWKELLGDL